MKQQFPLSKVQYGIYVECVEHQGEICYNLPFLYTLDKDLDAEKLCRAVETAVKVHPTLFTRIVLSDDGEPMQVTDEEYCDLTLQVEEVEDVMQYVSQLVMPFDIYKDRLFRMHLLRDAQHLYLFVDYHHLICDGSSMTVILQDIEQAYEGHVLQKESISLGEVVAEEMKLRQTPAFEEDKKWYAQQFDCEDVYSSVLPDLETEEHVEGQLKRTLDIGMDLVDAYCKEHGIFKSTFFNMAYAFLLARYNNEQESLFNTAYNGRNSELLSHTVGMFVRTLPVYAKFGADTTVQQFLSAGQEQMSGCRKHGLYAYSDLMLDLKLEIGTIFVWHGELFADEQFVGKPMNQLRIVNNTRSVPLYLKAFIQEGRFCVEAEYSANVYSVALIENLLESYETVLKGFLTQEKLSDIELTTQRQLSELDDFNSTELPYDVNETVVSLFRHQAASRPDKLAITYKDKQYTYAQVDELSDRLASCIAGKGLGAEDVVAILIPRCEWMVIVPMGVLKAGCAYLPLDPTYPKERLQFMMKDAGVRLLIADRELLALVDDFNGDVIYTDELKELPAVQQLPEGPTPHSLFCLIYTSGSTGLPKGCQMEERNIVAFCHMHLQVLHITAESRSAVYASFGFDATLDIYCILAVGAQLYVIPEEMRLDLAAMSEYVEQNGITHLFMTTQVGYQFAVNYESHTLQYLYTGGEKLASLVPPTSYKLINLYGPTETVCYVTSYLVNRELKDIPIGKAMPNVKLYVVDKEGHRLPVGAIGELWIAGRQVTRGYLNRAEKTAEVFTDNPFSVKEDYNRIYRTGDMVRYLPDGNIVYVGRRDGQVKIRGFRIELKEVEAVIREFPGIKDVTVQAYDEEGGGKYIAAFVVADSPIDIEALNRYIMEQKPPYMVPAVTMQIDAIPLNQNQKVNKRALPKPVRKVESEVPVEQAPMNVLEIELSDLIAQVLNHHDFGVTTILGYVGLTSISAIKLAVLVNKRYGVTLDSKSLVRAGTLQSIENEILKKLMTAEQTVDNHAEHKERLKSAPLSYAQTGVYFECLKNPTSTIYNIPSLLTYPVGTDAEKLAACVKQVVNGHQELSVHFTTQGDTILQTMEDSVPVEVPIIEMTSEQLAEYKKEFVRPFNLQKAPLYRFEIVKTGDRVHLLMDIHHLLFDGASVDLFIREVNSVMEGRTIDGEKYTYLDFVADQQKAEEADTFKEAQQFFAEKLKTCEGASEIAANLPKSNAQGWIGEEVCKPDFELAEAFCRAQGITPAHLFLAATAYVVSRYTNNREVYLCTVSNGRSNMKIADTVGMFVNTLALGLNIDDVQVTEFLHRTRETFDETLRHEDYPFARIATDYSFLPSIAYAYQVGVLSEYTVNGEAIELEVLELKVPKFKINIKIETRGVVVEYDDSMYSARLARGMAESIVAVAERMMKLPDSNVRKLSIVSDEQKKELAAIKQVATGDAPFRLMHECIAHYAKIQPDHEALVAVDAKYTYSEMEKVTNRMAHALRERGVKERDRVALLLPRTSRLILSLFAVLKAGAAYIPCDPDYPADRVKLILEDSEARYIITTADRLETVQAGKGIDVETLLAGDGNVDELATDITGDDLAYLIYTSGSTGRPKGVMLRHEGICNYLYGHPANVFAHAVLTDAHRILSVTTISFDAALQDIGMAFYNGKTLIVATEEQANNPLDLVSLIEEQQINMVSGTPSRWQAWLTSDDFCKALAHVDICRAGGEKFSDQLLEQLRSVTKARIFNCYGPTEITVASNNKELTNASRVTVGKPQLNVCEFIVDQDGNELPVGVVGELYIGGRGVARGYNNLEEMTRERFVEYQGVRVYKSGDYAMWLTDGDVVILGRTDHQIKLRGLRIEQGEIENVMLKVKGMKKVVIMIRKLNGKEHLCAYYTAEREIAPEALKAEISKTLTQYMVPTAYMQLKEMPLTPNGKTDVKALPEPQLAVNSAYEAPVNDTERTFCDIFARILQLDKVGATDNFFELGGTSLVVTQVIIEADKAKMHVAYGDVFTNPTPRKLAQLITGAGDTDEMDDVKNYDYTAIDQLLQQNMLSTFRNGERQSLGNVLVTGATGYLGIHILRELINSDVPHIYCLIRGKTKEAAESRLRSLLYYYFADAFKPLFEDRIRVVLGDVTQDLDEGLKVDTVFNCAAIVKHFSEGTEIEDVNIGGAQRCVDFCLKTGAKIVHVSTASTRGLWVGEAQEAVYTEKRLYMGQYLGNKYIYSKYMAERLILEAVAKKGLSAKIMRVGNLSARSTDGEFQANFSTNSFMGRIRVYNMLGCCPHLMRNKNVEFSPINEVARAIVLLATTPKECTVFHPYNIHGQFLGDVLMGLSKVGEGIRFVEQEEFEEAMEKAKNDPQKAKILSSLLAYQDMAHGQKTTDVARDNDYTIQVLYRLDFSWSPTSWDYVERMLTAIGGFGFFE